MLTDELFLILGWGLFMPVLAGSSLFRAYWAWKLNFHRNLSPTFSAPCVCCMVALEYTAESKEIISDKSTF